MGLGRFRRVAKRGDAFSFRRALDKARQKHRPSWLYHLAVPLAPLIGLGNVHSPWTGKARSIVRGDFLSDPLAVWAISDSHVFGLAVDSAASLDAIEETIDALQSEIVSLRDEVADLRAKADD